MAGRGNMKFRDPKAMNRKVRDYFAQCEVDDRPRTLAGLAAHLGLSRRTLNRYSARPGFEDVLELAKARIEAWVEERLFTGSASGAKFMLQNKLIDGPERDGERERENASLEQKMIRARARAGLNEDPVESGTGEGEADNG